MRAMILAGLAILAAGAAFTVPAVMARNAGAAATVAVSPNNTLVVETRARFEDGDAGTVLFTGHGIADARPGNLIVALADMSDQGANVAVTLATPQRLRRDGRFDGSGLATVRSAGGEARMPVKVSGRLRFTEAGLVLEGSFRSIKLGSGAGRSISGEFRGAQGNDAAR